MNLRLNNWRNEWEMDKEEVVEAIGAATPALSLTESEEEGGGQLDLPTEPMEEKLAITITIKTDFTGTGRTGSKADFAAVFQGRTQSANR